MLRAAVAVVMLVACHEPAGHQCDLATQTAAVRSADRKLLGAGADYAADGALRGRESELHASARARRQAAWRTVLEVLRPVTTAQPLTSAVKGADIPAWQTWYGGDDVRRLFVRLFARLDPAARTERARFEARAIDDALGWNVSSVDELPSWPEERWAAYVDAIDSAQKVAGIGGIAAVTYSPAAARHYLESYPEILACADDANIPPAFADGPPADSSTMVRRPIAAQACERVDIGPLFVAGGETLRATVDGELSADATITATRVDGEGPGCAAGGDEACEVSGPGAYALAINAGVSGLEGAVHVEYTEAMPAWSACLHGPFPLNAVVVKASWRRAQFGQLLPTYDTSGPALERLLGPGGTDDWGPGEGSADPGPDDIYTLELENGSIYRLAGLHIMTKELDHWQWTTLWWSPDPDSDFGADRPGTVTGPWAHYKMCTVTAFDEGDPDPAGGYTDTAPSLAAALTAARETGPGSWCSNPYLEQGAHNAGTNCVGCHQHAGTGLDSEAVLANPAAFPDRGRTLVRNNFPTDYSFALDEGDRIEGTFLEIVNQ